MSDPIQTTNVYAHLGVRMVRDDALGLTVSGTEYVLGLKDARAIAAALQSEAFAMSEAMSLRSTIMTDADPRWIGHTTEAGPFYIVDLRASWARRPYITVWRPNNKGYSYSLPWAGKYDKQTVDEGGDYYTTKQDTRQWKRFAVPCRIVEGLAIPIPEPGIIDGNVGPVLRNNVHTRDALRRARYVPVKELDHAE